MPDKKPEKLKVSPYFLNTASQFLLKFSPNPAIRGLNQALAPAARAKRRQEYGLNPWPSSPSPEAPSAPPPAAASKPSFGTNMRDFAIGSQERADEYTKRGWAQDATTAPAPQKREKQQSAVTIDLSTFAKGAVPMSATSDFTKAGAISTASGGNTNYAAGLGLADTSGLKEKASFTAPAPTFSKKEARQEKRAKRLEGRIAAQTAKGKTAVSEGRFIDAGNKQGRVQNLQKRVDRLRK